MYFKMYIAKPKVNQKLILTLLWSEIRPRQEEALKMTKVDFFACLNRPSDGVICTSNFFHSSVCICVCREAEINYNYIHTDTMLMHVCICKTYV